MDTQKVKELVRELNKHEVAPETRRVLDNLRDIVFPPPCPYKTGAKFDVGDACFDELMKWIGARLVSVELWEDHKPYAGDAPRKYEDLLEAGEIEEGDSPKDEVDEGGPLEPGDWLFRTYAHNDTDNTINWVLRKGYEVEIVTSTLFKVAGRYFNLL